MTPREKLIAGVAAAAVGVLGLNTVVVGPYVDRLRSIADETDKLTRQAGETADLFARQRRLRPVWADLTRGGLSADVSTAESQTANALYQWATSAGVAPVSLLPDRSSTENGFQVIGFRFTATGRTPAVAKLLWDVETATIPVRLTDVTVTPRKEGRDDLTVQMSISTLTLRPPEKAKPAGPAVAAVEGRS